MGYIVRCMDGPASGFSYYTGVPPDPLILIARNPRAGVHGEWMRVPVMPEWDHALEYRRDALDEGGERDSEGDLNVPYHHATPSP